MALTSHKTKNGEVAFSTERTAVLYGCQAWQMTREEEGKLESKRLPGTRSGTRTIDEQVSSLQWKWSRVIFLRMSPDTNLKIALTWVPDAKRRKRPQERCGRATDKERYM